MQLEMPDKYELRVMPESFTILAGNNKRYKKADLPSWIEKNKAIERMIIEIGIDEHLRREQELIQRYKDDY